VDAVFIHPFCFIDFKHIAMPLVHLCPIRDLKGFGAGFLVPAFLRLYWWRFNGTASAIGTLIGIARLSPKGYEELSRAHVIEPDNRDPGRPVVWSHPAFAHRRVYLRNDSEILCYDLAAH
jgi:hypothetical protein